MRESLKSARYAIFLAELRALRIGAKLSQTELASRLGVHQGIVSRCESGSRRVDVLELDQWASACNTTLHAFVRTLAERLAQEANTLEKVGRTRS